MEEKARLMVESSKLGSKIESLQKQIENLDKQIAEIPRKVQAEKVAVRDKDQRDFDQKHSNKLAAIKKAVADKRQEALNLIDTFPDLETQEFAGKYEVQDLEDHLMEIYPQEMIEDYVCLNPIPFADENEAYQAYSSAENMIFNLKQNNFSGIVFNGLSATLDKAADVPQLGVKVAFLVVFFIGVGLFYAPFAFLAFTAVLGAICGLHGMYIQNLLRKLYSVKMFLNNSYDEDIFQKDKGDLMSSVDSFLEEAQEEYIAEVESETFRFDESKFTAIDDKYEKQLQQINRAKDLYNQNIVDVQKQLENIIVEIERIEEEERKYAERARKEFLGKITWKTEWLSQIFLDVTPENKVKVMPFAKGNSFYYSSDIDNLKKLSRLIVFQCMLHMHPNYACSTVLDYKYNGGDLTQLGANPDNQCVLSLNYTEDNLNRRADLITSEIRARTNNILGTCESIEEYNKLMGEYGSTGEYYAVIHIFGLSALSTQFLNNIRNGPRVGYFFKFYLTLEEMAVLKDALNLADFVEFFEIKDNPIMRTPAIVERLLNPGA